MSRENTAAATLASVVGVLGALALFCVLFTAFLLIPFLIFLIAAGALMISEWGRKAKSESPTAPAETPLPAPRR